MKSLVSVIIPCFNNAKTIEKTIESVFNQTFHDVEIIIIDDGSADESVQKVNDIIKRQKDKNIWLTSQTNSGPSKARNLGALKSNGKYIMFLDADDLIHEEYLRLAVDVLEKDSSINIVYSNAEYFEAKKGKWKLKEFSEKQLLLENMIFISALIRKNVFENVGGFDERINHFEDWDLWMSIVFRYGGVYKIPKTLFYYRKRADSTSLTDNANASIQESVSFIYKKHQSHYQKNDLGIERLIDKANQYEKLYKKYYGVWYRKLFYSISKKRKPQL